MLKIFQCCTGCFKNFNVASVSHVDVSATTLDVPIFQTFRLHVAYVSVISMLQYNCLYHCSTQHVFHVECNICAFSVKKTLARLNYYDVMGIVSGVPVCCNIQSIVVAAAFFPDRMLHRNILFLATPNVASQYTSTHEMSRTSKVYGCNECLTCFDVAIFLTC